MIEITFFYEGCNYLLQSNSSDKMKDIFENFRKKVQAEKNTLFYLYLGNTINEELELERVISEDDKQTNKMKIIASLIDDCNESSCENSHKSKDILCPQCGEKCLLKMENFKIKLYNCKNGHISNYISLDDYEKIQKVEELNIKCEICHEKNRNNTYNNEFYECINCKKNICPLCKANHDATHKIINYDKKNYVCQTHFEPYIKYCNDCKLNLCSSCNGNHDTHNISLFENMNININEKKNEINNLGELIRENNNNITTIINLLNQMTYNLKTYHKIYNDMITNYENKNINYELIQSINQMDNNIVKKNLIEINTYKNIVNKINSLIDFSDILNNKTSDYNETVTYENGDKYIGEIKNGLKNGKGTMYYNNKDKYEGEWKNDKMEGTGTYTFHIDGSEYKGELKNDKMEGKGKFTFKNGNIYVGECYNNKREGKGILYYSDGNRYEGDYKNNVREGKGKMYYNDGSTYEGDYKDDKKEGWGIYKYSDGNIYEGNFKNNAKNGKGRMLYQNFGEYYGDWENDLKEGKGVLMFKNGNRYEGDFKNDIVMGKGVLYTNDGNRYEGDFNNFNREGQGIVYCKNGDRQMGNFLNNLCIGRHVVLHINGMPEIINY